MSTNLGLKNWAEYIHCYATLPIRVSRELWQLGATNSLPKVVKHFFRHSQVRNSWRRKSDNLNPLSARALTQEQEEVFERKYQHYTSVSEWLLYYLLTSDEIEAELSIPLEAFEAYLFHSDLLKAKPEAEGEIALINFLKEYRPSSNYS